MRALIIGCGYVGTALGSELAAQGVEVFGLRRSPAAKAELEKAGIKPLIADITRPEDLSRLPGPFDWVINTASSGGGGVDEYQRVYLEGARRIIDWLQTRLPAEFRRPAKYVYTSSTGVYAQNDGSWVTEESPTEPANPTGQVLVQTEQVLLKAWKETQFPAIILRVAGIYGPGRGYPYVQYLRGEARLEGDGRRIMNMIHREDVAGAIFAALRQGRPGEVYNVVDDEPVSQRDFYEWLSQALHGPMPPSVAPDETVQRKRGITNKRISNRKLKTELGYQLKYPTFREGYAGEMTKNQ